MTSTCIDLVHFSADIKLIFMQQEILVTYELNCDLGFADSLRKAVYVKLRM